MPDAPGFRLILSDALVDGGQRVGTFNPRPLSVEQVLKLLCTHFKFEELCKRRGLEASKLSAEGGVLRVAGVDGHRRVPVRTDKQLVDFLAAPQNTRLPSVEVQLAHGEKQPAAAEAAAGRRGRLPRDRIEELEDEKSKLKSINDRVERRLDELEKRFLESREDIQRNIGLTKKELTQSQVKASQQLQVKIDALGEADKAILKDLDVVRKHVARVEEQDMQGQEDLNQLVAAMGKRVQGQFEDVNVEIEQLKAADVELQQQITANFEEVKEDLRKHQEELERLEDVKVDVDVWRKAEEEMAEFNRQEFADLRESLAEAERRLRAELEEARAALRAAVEGVARDLEDNCRRIDADVERLSGDLKAGLKAAADALAKARAELEQDYDEKISALTHSTAERFEEFRKDVSAKDKTIHHKVDELAARTAKTFVELNERLEEFVRVERARLGTIERDFSESTTKIRSDFRTEIDRLRTDYEQDSSRIDADLGDLHTKNDVSKQEINFFQSRLVELKDWTQRQLTETATATRAVQVDSQEGLAASAKMIHALKDDAVAFREKMGKYISLLQHSSDSHGDAITALETQRGRMRAELDALIGDHKAYTGDMDGWANDVRLKVERLFRALEPPRAEWRICRALARAKELRRPLAVKSPSFSLRGLREVQVEFYPDGHMNSPEGKGVLRLFMPPHAHARYQCWVGKSTEGAREYRSGDGLSLDLPVQSWKDQLEEDGSLLIVMEVLADLNNEDASLSREVRIESQ